MKNSKKFLTFFALFFALSLTSCVETLVVGSAATASLVMREKTIQDTGQDLMIASKLEIDFVKSGLKSFGNSVDVMVNEGRVLLTGVVRDSSKAKIAAQLAWKISDVKEVIDEIQIEEKELRPTDFSNSIWDYLLTLRIESVLLFGKEISTVNYKVTTVRKNVYLIGVAQDSAELKRVLNKIAKIRGVKKIVNYVILADDARRR